jgi:hypothetical protein
MQRLNKEDPDFEVDDELEASLLMSVADDLQPYVTMLEYFGMMEVHNHLYTARQKLLDRVEQLKLQLNPISNKERCHA